MAALLLVSWVVTLVVSYKGAEYVLAKAGML